MKDFVLGPYRLMVDTEANRAYYARRPLPWITCGCDGCRNFVRTVQELSPKVRSFFGVLGLDVEKPGEIYTLEPAGSGDSCMYGGFYHLKGEILSDEPWEGLPEEAWVNLTSTFSVAFQRDCALVPEDFPCPCIQMEIFCRLPWRL